MTRRQRRSAPSGKADSRRESGAMYVHLQSESGVEHRTIVVSPRRVALLKALWSWRGGALLAAIVGSWLYFAFESLRVPVLTRRITELEAEGNRIDTLELRLRQLQEQYDRVTRMLGVEPTRSGDTTTTLR